MVSELFLGFFVEKLSLNQLQMRIFFSEKTFIYGLPFKNVRFFMNEAIFCELCDWMRFEVNCAKSHHGIISEALL